MQIMCDRQWESHTLFRLGAVRNCFLPCPKLLGPSAQREDIVAAEVLEPARTARARISALLLASTSTNPGTTRILARLTSSGKNRAQHLARF